MNAGSSWSRLIAIITRAAFKKATLLIPNPPPMNPSETRRTTHLLGASICTKMLMFGEYGGLTAPLP